MRVLLLCVLFFTIGFFVHAQFFSSLLPEQLFATIQKTAGMKTVSDTKQPAVNNQFNQSTTYVIYENGSFKPPKVITKKGNRLIIQNSDKEELMWLDSESTDFTTQRGFAYSEQFNIILPKQGNFSTINKLNPQTQLTIEVR